MHVIARSALATLLFAGLHSLLATEAVKRAAARRLGAERSHACYRAFFVGQSLLGFAALTAYALRLPRQTMYRIEGRPALLLRLGQASGLLPLLLGLQTVGPARWSGIARLQAWRRGCPLPAAPAAQGPERDDDGRLTAGGPYRYCRHPLNFAGLPLFWLTPHMTTRRFGFNVAGSIYLALGSLHEEARLRRAYGAQYQAYARSGVPFFLPQYTLRMAAGLSGLLYARHLLAARRQLPR